MCGGFPTIRPQDHLNRAALDEARLIGSTSWAGRAGSSMLCASERAEWVEGRLASSPQIDQGGPWVSG
jgi:hypothetical protein